MQTADRSKPRLVIFDVEGVLIPKNRFIFDVGKSLGVSMLLKMLLIGFLYEAGLVTLKWALRRIFKIMAGVKIAKIIKIFNEIPSNPQLLSLFDQLKDRNCKIALISSGIPSVIVEKLASTLHADYAVGVEVGLNDEALTGEIWGDAIETNGKRKVLTRILAAAGLNLEDCVVVADDRNNSCIFLSRAQKIGYNPDFVLRVKADNVITGRLSKILPLIDGKPRQWSLPSKNDLLREGIHASGFFIPVLSDLVGVYSVALMIFVISAVYSFSELLRMNNTNMPVISTITQNAASPAELYEFAAAPLYFATGILLTLLMFPAVVSSAAIAVFTLGDSTASLFGGLISKKSLPLNKSKTLEGSLIGFLFAFLAGAFFVPPMLALIAAAVAMTIESLPFPVNDNILIPLGTGLALLAML